MGKKATAQTGPSILLKGGTLLVHDDKDNVNPLRATDVLVQQNRITKIGKNIAAPPGTELVDCKGKIISPGFVDTHHHLWQTQLKGNHADLSVFDYILSGYWQSFVYTPKDMYWGQLGGALEAIDSGTTFVLDHAHGNRSNEHADQALAATVASGIRSIFAYSHAPYFTKWDSETCELSQDILPDSSMAHILELAKSQPFGNGANPLIHTLKSYNLIQSPSDILLSHATGLGPDEKAVLAETKVPISSTPDTEAQMGFGWPLAFERGINYTFGVDCHTNNTSSILSLARSTLQMARQREAVSHMKDAEGAPARMNLELRGSTQDAFNAATINGARALLLGDEIGSIKEGKLADLVIFDAANSPAMACVSESDPLTAVFRHSDIRDVEAVLIDGIWRKKNGKVLPVAVESGNTLDWSGVRQKLLESQREIEKRQKELNTEKARESLLAMFQIDKNSLIGNSKY